MRDEIMADLIHLLRRLRQVDGAREAGLRAYYRKKAAEALVRLRETHTRHDGRVDATGRSHAYRMDVREAFSDAGYTRENARREQAALRHHVSTLAREHFGDLLSEYDVLPYDRNQSIRNKRASAKIGA